MLAKLKTYCHTLTLPQKRVFWFCTLLIAGVVATLLNSLYHLLLAHVYYPKVTLFFDPRYRFSDFTEIYDYFKYGLAVFEHSGTNYFPFFLVLLYPISWFPAELMLPLCILATTAFYVVLVYRWLPQIPKKGVYTALITLFSFTLWALFDRGNVEMFVFMLTASCLWCYATKRFTWAALLLAIAINTKLYPAVFLVLFFAQRRWKPLLLALGASIVLFGVGAWLTHANFGVISSNLQAFSAQHQIMATGLQGSHTLFNLPRLPAFLVLEHGELGIFHSFPEYSAALLKPYFILVLILFALICLYVSFSKQPLWKIILLLTLAEIGFPFVSYGYTLMHLVFPALLFLHDFDGDTSAGYTILVLLVLLLSPMNYLAHNFYPSYFGCVLNIGCLLKPLIILYFIVFLMRDFNPREIARNLCHFLRGK
ncbi:MAG: DUF2029 domain-containing protein [Elusimicrobiaceae bacterium]|nr:DUF2029 domain-containing protein [Elusimicrobiaceae bacterium]